MLGAEVRGARRQMRTARSSSLPGGRGWRSAVDRRSGSKSKRQFEAFVAGHEARVESAKLRAASESSRSRPSATDRLRLLRERIAAKQVAGLACTSEGPSQLLD